MLKKNPISVIKAHHPPEQGGRGAHSKLLQGYLSLPAAGRE